MQEWPQGLHVVILYTPIVCSVYQYLFSQTVTGCLHANREPSKTVAAYAHGISSLYVKSLPMILPLAWVTVLPASICRGWGTTMLHCRNAKARLHELLQKSVPGVRACPEGLFSGKWTNVQTCAHIQYTWFQTNMSLVFKCFILLYII